MKYLMQNKKYFFWSLLLTLGTLEIFLLISNWAQVMQLFGIGLSFSGIIKSYFEILMQSILVLPFPLLLIFIAWTLSLYVTYLTALPLFLIKARNKLNIKTQSSKLGAVSTFFTFLGFGCVACGQTLLLSIVGIFFSATAVELEYISGVIMIIASILLFYTSYKNLQMLKNPNICPI